MLAVATTKLGCSCVVYNGFPYVDYEHMSHNFKATARKRIVPVEFDPKVQPVVSTQLLTPLMPESLELEFIRQAFKLPVDWKVEPLFKRSFQADSHYHEALRRAAVFVPLVQRPSGLHVVFTRRAAHLTDHAGQISFPGGRIEPYDKDEIAAALRETHEEIGIGPEYIQLIGTQPGYITSTQFTMKPVIGALKPGFTVTPDLQEVAEVFEVPLSVLLDPAQHRLHYAQIGNGEDRYYFSISWQSYFIWGATAALIRNFYHFLAAAQSVEHSGIILES